VKHASSAIGLGLMCKPPRPGTSKTRLASGIGAEAAARLSGAFLRDCAANVEDACRLIALDPVAYYRPQDGAAELRAILGPRWSLAYSDGGDLGATMAETLARLLDGCPNGAILTGADMPMMAAEVIAGAAAVLRDGDRSTVVIAPSFDGGYGLIGVKCIAATASLFAAMAWSTTQVFDETLRRANSAGLKVTVLETQRDIDDISDLEWLRTVIHTCPNRAHATRDALSALYSAG
jgi:rSAM/selenodomain-associated transferase 1